MLYNWIYPSLYQPAAATPKHAAFANIQLAKQVFKLLYLLVSKLGLKQIITIGPRFKLLGLLWYLLYILSTTTNSFSKRKGFSEKSSLT